MRSRTPTFQSANSWDSKARISSQPCVGAGERLLPSLLNNVRHWQERAEEARAVAGQMSDAEARRVMLGIADGYERLAKLAEARNEQPAASSGKRG